MRAFKECLDSCGLTDLGFVGQGFTWCNERLGNQRTLIRLDKMVANEEWRELFPEVEVHHVSMSASDHCLLALFLRHRTSPRPLKRRFFLKLCGPETRDAKR